MLLGRRHRVDSPIVRRRSGSIWTIEKEIAQTPRRPLILITPPSTRRQLEHLVRRKLKIFIHFWAISLWKSHALVLKTCGKTPGDRVNNKKAESRIKDSKKSPNKKDWEGGPGMLSNADLMKNRCNNFNKACKIAETMTTWRRMVNIELWWNRKMCFVPNLMRWTICIPSPQRLRLTKMGCTNCTSLIYRNPW